MKEFTDVKTTFINSIALLLLLFIFLHNPMSSGASCFCRLSQQNATTPLSQRLVPPNYRVVTYTPLTDVQHVLNYHNLTEIYVEVLENLQFLTFLKQEMGSRISEESEDVPPPNRYCFISERSNLIPTETNQSRFSSTLVDDLCMMVNLVTALDHAVQYERENRSNQYTFCLASAKYGVELIVEALSNITDMSVGHCATNTSSGGGLSRGSDEETDGGVTYSSRERNNIPDGDNAELAEKPTTAEPDPFDDQEVTRSPRDASTRHVIDIHLPVSEAAPTSRFHQQSRRSSEPAPANTNCGAVSSDNQQFVYVYEVWTGLWYLRNDLLPMRDHFAN